MRRGLVLAGAALLLLAGMPEGAAQPGSGSAQLAEPLRVARELVERNHDTRAIHDRAVEQLRPHIVDFLVKGGMPQAQAATATRDLILPDLRRRMDGFTDLAARSFAARFTTEELRELLRLTQRSGVRKLIEAIGRGEEPRVTESERREIEQAFATPVGQRLRQEAPSMRASLVRAADDYAQRMMMDVIRSNLPALRQRGLPG